MVYTCCITVCQGISTVCPSTTHHEGITAGFHGAHRDVAALVILEPPAQSFLEKDEADPCPEPEVQAEDEEFLRGLDTESKEEAINKFLDDMEVSTLCCAYPAGVDSVLRVPCK
jgi:hypothetical protein